jgi:hypothetical protein
MRFGSDTVRIFSVITFIIGTVPYMGVVLYGPSLALSQGQLLHLALSDDSQTALLTNNLFDDFLFCQLDSKQLLHYLLNSQFC